MRRAFANRVDKTAKALIEYARSIGFGYAGINGVWDGDLFWGRAVLPVDWKTPGKGITEGQGKLLASGFPLNFVSNTAQLDALKVEAMRVVA